MHLEEIREQLSLLLDQPVRNSLWTYLMDHSYVDEVMDGRGDINYLAKEARKIIRAVQGFGPGMPAPRLLAPTQPSRPLPTRQVELAEFRMEVISIFLAKQAQEDTDVRLFRSEELGHGLIAHDDVEDWIETHLSREAMHASGGSDSDKPNDPPVDSVPPSTASSGTERWLEYSVPSDSFLRSARISPGGVLGRLYDAAGGIMRRYPWKRAAATMFVLTGLVPSVQAIEHTISTRVVARQGENLVSLRRISMVIDPVVKPREVHDYYRDIRRKILPRRQRATSEKHLRLAAFVIEQRKEATWPQKMNAWNKAHPEGVWSGYQYKKADNFHRDATAVLKRLKRLMQEDYPISSDRSEAPEFIV